MTTRLLNNRSCKLLNWNECHVEGFGLVLEVLETPRGAGGGDGESFGFIIGLPADDQRPDEPGVVDSRAHARSALRAFGFAEFLSRLPQPLKCALRRRCLRPFLAAL